MSNPNAYYPHRWHRTGVALLCVILSHVLLSGCATNIEAGSHGDRDAAFFDDEKQLVWQPDEAIDLIDESGYISPTILAYLKERVVQELNEKGFDVVEPTQLADDNAMATTERMTIQLYLRTRREMVASQPAGQIEAPCFQPGCWRATCDIRQLTQIQTTGFLAADIYHRGKAIWRGWVERLLYPDERDQANTIIDTAVPLLFRDLSTNQSKPETQSR